MMTGFDFHAFLVAISLVFILEGLLPFLSPNKWRSLFVLIAHLSNDKVRVFGFSLMAIGVVVLWLLHR